MDFIFTALIPSLVTGFLLIRFSTQIADFFKKTGSTSGLDNPWSYKVMGFVIAIGYPIYDIASTIVFQGLK